MVKPRSVRLSRTLGVFDAVALAAPLAMTVSVMAIAPMVVRTAGRQAPAIFAVAAPLLLLLWLAMLERTSAAPGGGGPYSASLALGRRLWISFAIGQLGLLGYLALTILILDLIVEQLTTGLAQLFGLAIHPGWWILLVVTLVLTRALTGSAGWTRHRTVAAWIALLVPVVILTIAFQGSSPDVGEEFVPRIRNWWGPVALLGAGLWALQPVMSRRDELKYPDRTTLVTAIAVWLGCMLSAVFGVVVVLRNPGVTLDNWLYGADPGRDRLQVAAIVAIAFLGWIALVRLAVAATRTVERMIEDRFLPSRLRLGQTEGPALGAILIFHSLAAAGALAPIAPPVIAGVAAFAFFLTLVLVLAPWSRIPAGELPSRRRPKLPLHPLVPGTAIAISVLLLLVLPRTSLLVGGVWVVLVALFWQLHSRAASAEMLHESGLVVAEEGPSTDRDHRVLVFASDDRALSSLLHLAMAVADSNDGEVVVLRVVEQSASPFPSLLRSRAHLVQRRLEELCDTLVPDPDQRIQALVRIAPDETSGILATAAELDVDLLLLPCLGDGSAGEHDETIAEEVLAGTERPVGLLHGRLERRPRSITVATGGGPHAPWALRLASEINRRGDVELLTVVAASLPAARGDAVLTATLAEGVESKPGDESVAPAGPTAITQRAVNAATVEEGLREASAEKDLLIAGVALDRLLGRSSLGGPSTETARRREGATLLVKRPQPRTRFVLAHLWGLVADVLPTLTVTERSEVFAAMRSAARANVDFYVLISLSSAIATFGLRQSSTAVVIGAMLVAPLMSPILALGHGIVQGHVYMIRRAAVSTAQGTATALGISALAALLLPEAPPTPEMLARGAPTLLDLGVAVFAGAAAAYGVSRKSVAASLPGVAIAVALVPPLCVAGHSLGASDFALASGSFILFLTNLAGIVLTGALVFLALGFRPSSATRDERVLRGLVFTALALLLLAIPLTWEGRNLRRAQTLEASIEQLVERGGGDTVVRDVAVGREGGALVVRATLYVLDPIAPDALSDAERQLSQRMGTPVRIEATVVRAERLTAETPAPPTPTEGPSGAP